MYIINNVGIYQLFVDSECLSTVYSLYEGLDLFKDLVETVDCTALIELVVRRPNKDGSFSREICRKRKPSDTFRGKWVTRVDESGCVYTYCRHCSAEGGCGC